MEASRRKVKKRYRLALVLVLLLTAFAGKAWSDTMATPVLHRTSAKLADFPAGAAPVTIALISDIHVAGPDMPPERVATIVEQINRLKPDYLLVAGDFISEKRASTRLYSAKEAIAPLFKLDPAITKIAVPGNHDHWFNMMEIGNQLSAAGFNVMKNEAAQYGPLVIGGLDDDYTGRADLPRTVASMGKFNGARLILSHSPDPFPDMPRSFGLMLAGHTHCGQIRYPWGGSPATMSRYGNRYACGIVSENGNELITTAGLGTSVLPFRLFSKPEIWLIEIGPQ
ncbi:MAG: metallophosphoesterase [Pontixanthobacter sp.]